jgi:hypothetical protein
MCFELVCDSVVEFDILYYENQVGHDLVVNLSLIDILKISGKENPAEFFAIICYYVCC